MFGHLPAAPATAGSPQAGGRVSSRRPSGTSAVDRPHLLARSPRRLLLVATANITNAALLALFEIHLDAIVGLLGEADFVELGPDALVVHRRRGDGPAR